MLYFIRDSCMDEISLGWVTTLKVTKESEKIKCYDLKVENVIQNLETSEVAINRSIFFVETSCHNEEFNINPRQACAIESAAKMNPNFEVYLLIPSPVTSLEGMKDYFKKLASYPNFKIRYINMTTFFTKTPLEHWYLSGNLKYSYWPQSHASDVLRYTLLWKFGGIYMDLDVVIMRSLEQVTNFAGAESLSAVAAGIMSFSHNHKISSLTINDLLNNFRGYDWGWNGPGVITRSLQKYCGDCKVKHMLEKGCEDFIVFPPSAFYPIPWEEWAKYFTLDEEIYTKVMDQIKDSYAIHVWNKHSVKTKVTIGSKQPYGVIAQKYCPMVYSSLKDYF